MKKAIFITLFCSLSLQANAGFWDNISSIFGSSETETKEATQTDGGTTANATANISANSEVSVNNGVSLNAAANASEESASSSMIQTGIQLLPLLTQTLGISTTQATGGMGALLQTAQSLLSGGDFSVIASAIPGVSDLLGAAPDVSGSANSSLLGSAMSMVGDASPSLKAGAELVSQFKSLGMGAEMIPKFTDVGSNYLEQNGNTEASILLDAAISGAL